MARSGSRLDSRGVVATWLLILVAGTGILVACGNDGGAEPEIDRPSAPSTTVEDRAPTPGEQPATVEHPGNRRNLVRHQGGACLVIAPDGNVDDGQGRPWIAEGQTATIAAASERRFVLTSNASPQPNELELSSDGKQLTAVGSTDTYIKQG